MEKEPVVYYNIALTFQCSPENEQRFIDWSEKIHDEIGSHITLNREDMFVHISLYNVPFPEKNIPDVEKRLADLASTLKPFDLKFNAKSNVGEYIFVDAVSSDYLQEIHESLIRTLNDLREGEIYPHTLEATDLTERQRENIYETGMRLSREDFQPHVTVAVVKSADNIESALQAIDGEIQIQIRIESLSFVETAHGEHVRKSERSSRCLQRNEHQESC